MDYRGDRHIHRLGDLIAVRKQQGAMLGIYNGAAPFTISVIILSVSVIPRGERILMKSDQR